MISSRAGMTRLTLEDARRRAMRSRGAREVSGKVQMRAMMPGRVLSVAVKAGDQVEAQQGVLVIEAMKMENELKSPKAGKVVDCYRRSDRRKRRITDRDRVRFCRGLGIDVPAKFIYGFEK